MEYQMKAPPEIRRILQELRATILRSSASDLNDTKNGEPREGWRGADVIVTDDFEREPGWMESHKLWVRTRHASPLGWLFRRVRDAFYGWYDFRNKYGFFGSLGSVALDYLVQHQPESEDHRPLLLAVLAQGESWADVLDRDDCLPDNAPIVIHLKDPEGRQLRVDVATGKETI